MWAEQECPCGQSFPVIKEVIGRTSDFLVRLDGSPIAPTSVTPNVAQFRNVLYTQLVQEVPGLVEVRVVPGPGFADPQSTLPVFNHMRDMLGKDMTITIRICSIEDLVRNPVGKVRACFTTVKTGEATSVAVEA